MVNKKLKILAIGIAFLNNNIWCGVGCTSYLSRIFCSRRTRESNLENHRSVVPATPVPATPRPWSLEHIKDENISLTEKESLINEMIDKFDKLLKAKNINLKEINDLTEIAASVSYLRFYKNIKNIDAKLPSLYDVGDKFKTSQYISDYFDLLITNVIYSHNRIGAQSDDSKKFQKHLQRLLSSLEKMSLILHFVLCNAGLIILEMPKSDDEVNTSIIIEELYAQNYDALALSYLFTKYIESKYLTDVDIANANNNDIIYAMIFFCLLNSKDTHATRSAPHIELLRDRESRRLMESMQDISANGLQYSREDLRNKIRNVFFDLTIYLYIELIATYYIDMPCKPRARNVLRLLAGVGGIISVVVFSECMVVGVIIRAGVYGVTGFSGLGGLWCHGASFGHGSYADDYEKIKESINKQTNSRADDDLLDNILRLCFAQKDCNISKLKNKEYLDELKNRIHKQYKQTEDYKLREIDPAKNIALYTDKDIESFILIDAKKVELGKLKKFAKSRIKTLEHLSDSDTQDFLERAKFTAKAPIIKPFKALSKYCIDKIYPKVPPSDLDVFLENAPMLMIEIVKRKGLDIIERSTDDCGRDHVKALLHKSTRPSKSKASSSSAIAHA